MTASDGQWYDPNRRGNKALLLIVAILLVIGGSAWFGWFRPTPASAPGSRTPAADVVSVPWADYAGDLRSRIDGLGASRDCSALQREFDAADANNDATMTRTGHNNAALMGYIDAKLRASGCY